MKIKIWVNFLFYNFLKCARWEGLINVFCKLIYEACWFCCLLICRIEIKKIALIGLLYLPSRKRSVMREAWHLKTGSLRSAMSPGSFTFSDLELTRNWKNQRGFYNEENTEYCQSRKLNNQWNNRASSFAITIYY